MQLRDEPTYPLVGLCLLLIVSAGFWSGVILIAEKLLP